MKDAKYYKQMKELSEGYMNMAEQAKSEEIKTKYLRMAELHDRAAKRETARPKPDISDKLEN